jgi:STE24 endopeptidase
MKRLVTLCALSLALLLAGAAASAVRPPDLTAARGFDARAASKNYLAQVPADKKASSDRYFEGGYWFYVCGILYTFTLMLLLLVTGASARIRDFVMRLTARPNLQTAAYIVPFLLITAVLQFPLAFYRDFVREHQYGLSKQAFGPWVRDFVLGWVVLVVFATLLGVALFVLVRRLGRSWWTWATAATVFFIVLALMIEPVFVDPLFNRYTALENGPVRDAVLSMARANGISVTDVYVSDASRQTTRISANVNGFLATDRITLNDNLLKRCSLPEIQAVMGHEMGHYVLNHNFEEVLFLAILAFLLFRWLDWSAHLALRRWGNHWRIRELGDPAVAPLAIAIICVFFLATTPIRNSFEREQEYEADIFGLNAAGQPDGFAQVALKFADYRKLEPSKWEEIVFYDHPSGRTRIYSAMRWKAEHLAQLSGWQASSVK